MKISQTELGKKEGLSRQTFSSIEREAVELSWNSYLAIMKLWIIKKMYQDDSKELIEIMNIVNIKLQAVVEERI